MILRKKKTLSLKILTQGTNIKAVSHVSTPKLYIRILQEQRTGTV